MSITCSQCRCRLPGHNSKTVRVKLRCLTKVFAASWRFQASKSRRLPALCLWSHRVVCHSKLRGVPKGWRLEVQQSGLAFPQVTLKPSKFLWCAAAHLRGETRVGRLV